MTIHVRRSHFADHYLTPYLEDTSFAECFVTPHIEAASLLGVL